MNKQCFSDAHIHIADIKNWEPVNYSPVCSCAHSVSEFKILEQMKSKYPDSVEVAYGIHPQNPDVTQIEYLTELVQSNKINVIGEAGFDLFDAYFVSQFSEQETVWRYQLDLAVKYDKKLVIHCRKALDKLYSFSSELSKVPVVIFHSFPGSPAEALGFLKRGVNAYFSLSKQLLNGNKRAISCAMQLPIERILLETDAPFQTLKGQIETPPKDIIRVYHQFAKLRNENLEKICQVISENFNSAFNF